MRKRLLAALICLVTGILAMIPAINDPSLANKNPLDNTFVLSYPSYAIQDHQGGIIAIDHGLTRLTRLSPDGRVTWQSLGSERQGGFFFASEVASDRKGYIYVLNQVMFPEGFRTQREEILRLSPDGKFDRVLYSYTYRPDELNNHLVTRGKWMGLQINEPYVVWYQLENRGVVESKIHLDTFKLEQELVKSIPDSPAWVSSAARIDQDHFAYVLKNGEIRLASKGSEDRILYASASQGPQGSSVPWWVKVNAQGALVYSDLGRQSLNRLDIDGTVDTLYDNSQLIALNGDDFPYIYYTFSFNTPDAMVTVNDFSALLISSDGKLEREVNGGVYDISIILGRLFYWVALVLFAGALALLTHLMYATVLKKRISLIAKQIAVLLPLMVGILAFVAVFLLDGFTEKYNQQAFEQISQTIQLVAAGVDTERLARIRSQADYMGEDYQAIRSYLQKAFNYNQDPWNAKIYFSLYRILDGNILTLMYLNDQVTPVHPFTYLNDPSLSFWKAAKGTITSDSSLDFWGSWVFGVGPIYDQEGNVVALLEVGRDNYGFQQDYQAIIRSVMPYIIASFAILILAFSSFTWFIMSPLRALRTGVIRISEGEWGKTLPVRGHDEVADLTLVFNRMTTYIRNYIEEIMALSHGYQRFVPKEFLTFLDTQSVKEINLGDQIQRDMTVLFSDIRGFTSLSEALSPSENFQFLNQYLGLMGPQVRKNNGFIDKYIGDAIMALFPSRADDAVQTAIDILDLLHSFNKERRRLNEPQIEIGLGIHTGKLMLGILGESERFDGTVISDNVNLASRVEGLTKHFDSPILITQDTYQNLENPDRYLLRYLGIVKVKGKKDAVGLWEVLDGSPAEVKSKKMQCSDNLQSGIRAYQERRFDDAVQDLEIALAIYPKDVPSRIYLSLARQAKTSRIGEVWTGAIIMGSK